MFSNGLFFAAAWLLFAPSAFAQQFPIRKTAYDTLGLSGPCLEALNTTIECSDRLAKHVVWEASSVGLLDHDGLVAVCEDACRKSLTDLRTKISNSCDAAADIIQYNHLRYPATYIVDRYRYFYDVSCYKDRFSGEFCDDVVARWRNETGGSEAHFCNDCWLGPMSVQLSSPIGYNIERADEFASLTRSCSADIYSTATTTSYGGTSTVAGEGLVTSATTTDAASETSSAIETPLIYPLLELGTEASIKAMENKQETRRHQRSSFKKKAPQQKRDGQLNPHAPNTAEDCLEYQNFLPFELLYKSVDRDLEDLDDYGINGCRYTATKHGISRK